MNLTDLIERIKPEPWSEGDNIPWNEPDFSRRMLREHLSQEHDKASRRASVIDQQVDFIHEIVLGSRPSRILDLGCGPGLYAQRLAASGHSVRGIDFSPASIAYARENAAAKGLDCTYTLGDVRTTAFEAAAYDLVMFIYGEFNVFCPADVRAILGKAYAALKPGGKLLLEPSNEKSIQTLGVEPAGWYTAQSGLFSDEPYLLLKETFWDAQIRAATTRYYCVDAASGRVERYVASYQAYSTEALCALLESTGFQNDCIYPGLTDGEQPGDFYAMTAIRS